MKKIEYIKSKVEYRQNTSEQSVEVENQNIQNQPLKGETSGVDNEFADKNTDKVIIISEVVLFYKDSHVYSFKI